MESDIFRLNLDIEHDITLGFNQRKYPQTKFSCFLCPSRVFLIYHLSFGMFPGLGYLVLGKDMLGISMLEYKWPFCCYFGVKCLNLTTMVVHVHTTEDVLCSNGTNLSASVPV